MGRIFDRDIDRAADDLERAHDFIRKAIETLEAVNEASDGDASDLPTWNHLMNTAQLAENYASEAMEAAVSVSVSEEAPED